MTVFAPAGAFVATPDVPYTQVEVHAEAAAVENAWAELERAVPCSIYQTRRFLQPWTETLGRHHGLLPRYMLARDNDGRPVGLFCVGLRRHGPVTVATMLGGKDANLQLALIRPGSAWTRAALRSLLREAARRVGADAFVFLNQPHELGGVANPLALLAHGDSPSAAWGTRLPRTADALFAAKLSKDARKKLRKKEAKLAALGPLRHLVAATPEERAAVLDAFLAQKIARFDERGVVSDFGSAAMRDFIERAAAAEPPGIELHALLVGEQIVATFGGAAQGGRWSGMFNSFEAAEAIARSSPADLLLQRIVAHCCARGMQAFDLGVGEARYKQALCDEPIALFDAAIGFGPLGRATAALVLARQAAKRRVKSSPRLLALVNGFKAKGFKAKANRPEEAKA